MNETQALEVIPEKLDQLALQHGAVIPEQKAAITPAQAKVDAIAHLTMTAYQKAATLELTPEESAKLQADFPDEAFQPGAAGKENLIYIEHAHLRDRFNEVFGMGKWAIVPRNRWAESFTTAKGTPGERVYVEAMLVVRGCFVGEAVGAMEYYPKNESQNYGDAVEGAKTAAFRRCAKEFGVGLQAWKKDWCLGWWQRRRGQKPARTSPTVQTPQPDPKSTPSQGQAPASEGKKEAPEPTEAHKARLLTILAPLGEAALEYCQKCGMLLSTETLADLPLRFVPATAAQKDQFMACVQAFVDGGEAKKPAFVSGNPLTTTLENIQKKAEEQTAEPWRSFPMPFGARAGVKLADLPKNYLFGLWANYKVETVYNGKPKKPETIQRDTVFRKMLDAAGVHYKFEKPDDTPKYDGPIDGQDEPAF